MEKDKLIEKLTKKIHRLKKERLIFDETMLTTGELDLILTSLTAPVSDGKEEEPSWRKAKNICGKYIVEHPTFPEAMKSEIIAMIADHFRIIQTTVGLIELQYLRDTQVSNLTKTPDAG